MTTPAHRLRQTIDEVIAAAHPRPVQLEEIYRAVEGSVVFDGDDLTPPQLRGAPVGEPSWKRNVRNVLQQGKQAGTLINIQRNAWRQPSPNPEFHLDPGSAWPEVHRAAVIAIADGTTFASTQLEKRYQVINVEPQRISVRRLDSRKPETVTAGEVTRAAKYLNAAGGRLGRGTVHHTVTKEVSIVHLHPRLAWDAESEWIVVVNATELESAPPAIQRFGDAPNDDPTRRIQVTRIARDRQSEFRDNLLTAYDRRCAISGWGPSAVLEAAHILLHADSGVNETDNGLLLRSDLHILFDEGLLRIDPDSLRVSLDPSLTGTPYWDWNGASLRPRVDGKHPSREYLRARWTGVKTAQADRETVVPVG